MCFLALCLLEANDTTEIALERGVTPSQRSSVIIGHWKVNNALHPLSLAISSPLFSVITNSS